MTISSSSPLSSTLEQLTPPAMEPITLTQAKNWLRIDHNQDDSLLQELIIAVRRHAESFMRRALVSRTYKVSMVGYLPNVVRLPMMPVQSIEAITLLDEQQNATVLDAADYRILPGAQYVQLEQSVLSHRVEIEYTAGYGTADDIPEELKQGMLMHLAALYDGDHSKQYASIPQVALGLYLPFRVLGV